MKKKIMLLSGLLLVMGFQLMGASAQEVLRKAREDYYRQEKERGRAQKTTSRPSKAGEVTDLTVTEEGVMVETVEGEYPTLEREKEPKPKNEMERLERTAAKAVDKVDFYERVVRSVAREETDLKGYNEVLGKKKTKYNRVPKVTGLGK